MVSMNENNCINTIFPRKDQTTHLIGKYSRIMASNNTFTEFILQQQQFIMQQQQQFQDKLMPHTNENQ